MVDILLAPALGTEAKCCVGLEDPYGTPVVVTQALPLLSETLTDDPNFIEDMVLMGRGVGRQPDMGTRPLKGDIHLRLRYLNDIFLLQQLFGFYLDLGGGTHIYLPKQSIFGLGATVAFEDGQIVREYSGVKPWKAVLDGKPTDVVLTLSVMATGYTRSSLINTHGVLAAVPFDNSDNVLFTDSAWRFGLQGTVLTPDDELGLEAWQMTFERPMKEVYTNQSRFMQQPVENGLRLSSIAFNEPYYQTTQFHDWRDTAARLQAELFLRDEKSTHTKHVVMPQVTLKTVKAAINGPVAIPLTMGAELRESEDTLVSTAVAFSLTVAASDVLTTDNTNAANTSTVTVDGKVYTFMTTMTPAEGEVHIGGSADASLLNLARAINGTGGVNGTDYQVAAAHPTVSSSASVTSHTITLTARTKGTAGNSIAVSSTTSPNSHITAATATLTGGVDNAMTISSGVRATGTLTLTGAVIDGETVTIGVATDTDVYEVDTESPARITAPNIRLDLTGGGTRQAKGTLTVAVQPTAGDTFTLDAKVYTFDAHNVLTQTNGHIEIGASLAQTQANIVNAINLTGVGGVGYAINMTKHASVTIALFSATAAVVTANKGGTAGNSIASTSTFTSGSNNFDAATLGTTQAGVNPTAQEFITSLLAAILASGTALVTAVQGTGTTVVVTAEFVGTAGNSITTTETLSNGSWGAATLGSGSGSSDAFPWMQRYYDVTVSGSSNAANNGRAPVVSWTPYKVILQVAANGGLDLATVSAGDTVKVTSRSYDMAMYET